ncbi:MAG: DNA replication/repair protein RecF [Propionibacteriaceae bacterium]|jgi:DNA replication and repair protein RecF|nr:DNA replication/repair protein RecF [Propionibacteriaceae bacterium]
MYVSDLSLKSFRNYQQLDVVFVPGVTVFLGANGQGKTNLVEAVEYLSTLCSHRSATVAPLVRSGDLQAVLRARVVAGVDDPRTLQLELEINPTTANRARLNRMPASLRQLPTALRTVLFTPDDLDIVKGGPAARRDFIDFLVSARWPRFIGVRSDLAKVLKQRNALLKQVAHCGGRLSEEEIITLEVWDERLIGFSADLIAARVNTIRDLMPYLTALYAGISPVSETVVAHYLSAATTEPDVITTTYEIWVDNLTTALRIRRNEELRAGVTLVGPHRDDIEFKIGLFPARGYISHGEAWSLALALKLAAYQLLRADSINPVLILDDVFAELDKTRRTRLATHIADAEQVLITAAVDDDVPEVLHGVRFRVEAGNVSAIGD